MPRPRRQKTTRAHYYVLLNNTSAAYSPQLVDRLITAIRARNHYYTIYEASTAADLVARARLACGLKKTRRPVPPPIKRRGPVTALVAGGGDGTFSAVAEVAFEAGLPVGSVPIGHFNNIARALFGDANVDAAIARLLARHYRAIDSGTVSGKFFVGSLGIGLIPQLARLLKQGRPPRLSLGWSRLGEKAQARVKAHRMSVAIDSFHFDCRPRILNINLLPYVVGLPFSPMSICDDQQAEVLFDLGTQQFNSGAFVRQVYRRKHVFGTSVRLFRGRHIMIQPTKGQTMYLDGELMDSPADVLEISLNEKHLKVFC